MDKSKEVSEKFKAAMEILDKAFSQAKKEIGEGLFDIVEPKEEKDKDFSI